MNKNINYMFNKIYIKLLIYSLIYNDINKLAFWNNLCIAVNQSTPQLRFTNEGT